MGPKRLILYVTQAVQRVATEGMEKTANFKDGGRFPNAISCNFVWVNLDMVLNVFTIIQPVVNFFWSRPCFWNCTGLIAQHGTFSAFNCQ